MEKLGAAFPWKFAQFISDIKRRAHMREPKDLSEKEAYEFIRDIKSVLFLDVDQIGDFWNPDKDLGSDHIGLLVELMHRYDLVPENERELSWWSVGHGKESKTGVVRAKTEDDAIERYIAFLSEKYGVAHPLAMSLDKEKFWATSIRDTDMDVIP